MKYIQIQTEWLVRLIVTLLVDTHIYISTKNTHKKFQNKLRFKNKIITIHLQWIFFISQWRKEMSWESIHMSERIFILAFWIHMMCKKGIEIIYNFTSDEFFSMKKQMIQRSAWNIKCTFDLFRVITQQHFVLIVKNKKISFQPILWFIIQLKNIQ